MQVRTRSLVVAAVVLLAGCGGGDGKASVPTVTFAGGSSSSSGGTSTVAGDTTTAPSATTSTAAPSTTTTTAAAATSTTTAGSAATSPTTGVLASLPPGYTEVTLVPIDPAVADTVVAGYQAFQTARRAVLVAPTAPPWDGLRATATAELFATVQRTYQDFFAKGQAYAYQGSVVSRAKVIDVRGDQTAVVEDCVTAWGYVIDATTGEPAPDQDAAVAGPTNTAYRAVLSRDGAVWKMASYDTGTLGACVGV